MDGESDPLTEGIEETKALLARMEAVTPAEEDRFGFDLSRRSLAKRLAQLEAERGGTPPPPPATPSKSN